jgi:hypothetical protein
VFCIRESKLRKFNDNILTSVTEPHNFDAAPAQGKNFDAAPALESTLLYTKQTFVK